VTCVDVLPERVAAVNNATPLFYEPGLADILSTTTREGRLRATADTVAAVAASDITFLAVGTPSRNGEIDLSYLRAAAEEVGKGMRASKGHPVVVVKSTVVPGTTDTLVLETLERTSGRKAGDFGLCMNPEFLREGSAVADFMTPDRIVIGQWDAASGSRMSELYRAFDCPKLFTTLRNAEMTKYASNALLATLISFSNEFAALCEATPGTDVEFVMSALHLDRRLSPMSESHRITPGILSYLWAGCGFGGSCLPKDVAALRNFAGGNGVETKLLDAVAGVNAARPAQLIALLESVLGSLRGTTIAVLGLAFKPGTDDLRDSPAIALLNLLKRAGASVRAYDPMVAKLPGDSAEVAASMETALRGADATVVATAWPEFAAGDWSALCRTMRQPILVDGRNALRGVKLPEDAVYVPIGAHYTPKGIVLGK
ncbi:MAG TPA: nucleotide sugar dehydrogenase, partial [Terriglobales bacterium]|nr:nucleotide sugar dehydrogenase [Terriglobales bacterium]